MFAGDTQVNHKTPAGGSRPRLVLRPLPVVLAAIWAGTAMSVYAARPFVGPAFWRAGRADILINIVLYVPLGIVLSRYGVWRCALAGAVLSSAAEMTQVFLPDRFTALTDVAANTLGAAVGCLVFGLIGERGRRLLSSTPLTRGLGALFVLMCVGFVGWVSRPGLPSDFRNWDPECRLAVGDEFTGGRHWSGEIREIIVLADCIDAEAVQHASDGGDANLSELRAGAAFTRRYAGDFQTVRETSPLDSLELVRFYKTLTEANAISVLVWFRTDDESQIGPARIVSYSTGKWKQNFALGQERRDIVWRVLTPTTAPGGYTPQLETHGVLTAGRDCMVAATYDGRISRVYLDGRLISRLNLRAQGRSSPFLADIGLPASAICVGVLLGLGLIGVTQLRGRSRWLTGAAAGFLGAVGFIAAGGADALPEFGPWILLLGLTGGVVAGFSTVEKPRTPPA